MQLLICLSLILVALPYLMFGSYALSTENAIEYEGPCLWAASRLAQGLNAYPGELLQESPYSVIIYPPVYFILSSLFLHNGLSYLPMRLISIFSTLVSAVSYYFFLRFYGLKKSNCLTGTGFLLSFMAIWLWSAKARVDMLSIALSCAALCSYSYALKETRHPYLFLGLSAVLLALAALTKQPAALLAIAMQIGLFFTTFPTRLNNQDTQKPISAKQKLLICGAAFGGVFTITLSACIIATNHLTKGGFIEHMHFASHMPFFSKYLFERLSLMMIDLPKVILAVLAAVLVLWQNFKSKSAPPHIFTLSTMMLLATIPTTFYTAGTHYSNVNHFLTALLALPALICLGIDRLGKGFSYLSATVLLVSTALLAYLGFSLFGPSANARQPALAAPIPQAKLGEVICPKIDQLKIDQSEVPSILSEDAGIATLMGATSEPVDITTFIQVLGLDGRQAQSMLAKIKGKAYRAVVINHKEFTGERDAPQWSKEIIQAVKDNYNYYGQTSGNGEMHDIYLPKSK